MTTIETFDRDKVRGWIEEAFDVALSLSDSSPDTLIAQAQAAGLEPAHLRLWIYDQPKIDWSPGALAAWAAANNLGTEKR